MINKKLKAIASLIKPNIKVFDIGCDHALLDIYLTLYNDNLCVATDISKNVLKRSITNINKYNLEDKIEVIATDGLKGLDIKKEDIVVISGMGTDTILTILEEKTVDNLIISSNTKLEDLRRNIIKKYTIINEIVVYENKKYYVIIKLKKGKSRLSKKKQFLGKCNYNEYKSYYIYLLKKYNKIMKQLPKNKVLQRGNIKKRIKYLKTVV